MVEPQFLIFSALYHSIFLKIFLQRVFLRVWFHIFLLWFRRIFHFLNFKWSRFKARCLFCINPPLSYFLSRKAFTHFQYHHQMPSFFAQPKFILSIFVEVAYQYFQVLRPSFSLKFVYFARSFT